MTTKTYKVPKKSKKKTEPDINVKVPEEKKKPFIHEKSQWRKLFGGE